MDLRDLLNEDQLNCLYCNYRCEVKASSYATSAGNYHDHVAMFNCNNCHEEFSIIVTTSSYTNILDGSKTEHLLLQQFFSCKTIIVSIKNDKFFISNKISKEIEIPPFKIDFKNKEELYNKLRTYLLFS